MPKIFDRLSSKDKEEIADVTAEPQSRVPERPRVQGRIIKLSDEGWGFISSKDIKFTRIFFHWTSLKQDTLKFTELKNGMKVEFTPQDLGEKGWRAIKIKVVVKDKETENESIKKTEEKTN